MKEPAILCKFRAKHPAETVLADVHEGDHHIYIGKITIYIHRLTSWGKLRLSVILGEGLSQPACLNHVYVPLVERGKHLAYMSATLYTNIK